MSVAATPNPFQNVTNSEFRKEFYLPKIVQNSSREQPKRAGSRASSLGELVDRYRLNEFNDNSFISAKSNRANELYENSNGSFNIPEGVRAIYTPDINKISMPIFGNRPASTASLDNFKNSTQAKIDIEDYYNLIRDKVKTNSNEIRIKFNNADPDGKGGVTKEALAHIIASLLGPSKPLSHQQFVRLTEKLALKNRSFIKYEDFIGCFQENRNEATSEWVDPVRGGSSIKTTPVRKATQVFVILKEKANLKTGDLCSLIPQLNGDQPRKIFKPELLHTITSMGIKMDSEEYEKLWKKFDTENNGYIKSEIFLKRLGISNELNSDSSELISQSIDTFEPEENVSHIPYATVTESKIQAKNSKNKKSKTNPMEKWLKKRFRDGFSKMKASFEDIDRQQTGQVRRDQFLNVLKEHGLKMENKLLDAFLERCDIKLPNNSLLISYVDFLEKFQNRSDQGLAYRLITSGGFNDDRSVSSIGQVERKLLKLFQNDFLSLLQIFRKIDRSKTNTISKQEFRAALESQFGIEINDAEFEDFFKDVPKDGSNRIKYLDFMTRFDTDSSASLFDAQSMKSEDYQPKIVKKREYEPILEENEDLFSPRETKNSNRIKDLNEIIKDKIKNHYKDVENAWSEVDPSNSNEMNKDMMWKLFKKLKITPEISREEINLLWNQFLLKDNNRLEYWQFIRHFGYSKKSAAFTNSKKSPPKRGDNDMMLTSNKLGRDSILIRGSVQSKLFLQFDILKRSYNEIDPHQTGYVLRDEFEEILRELCPELNEQEMEYICSKHENQANSRINYADFLAPYSPRRNREKPEDSLKTTDNPPSSRMDSSDTLILKLRMKLSDNYKELRRAFKQHDFKQTGFVTVSSFKETLKGARASLTEEEMYLLMRKLDRDVTGMINYNKFINDMIKP